MGTAGRLAVFSPEEMRRLDAGALEVLEEVGVAIPSERAREALAAVGADIDDDVVRLAPDLVRHLVSLAPSSLILGARVAPPLVTGGRALVTTDGCCVEIYDLDSGEKRRTVASDVAAIAHVADGMPEIDFCWPSVSAHDRPVERRGLHELYLAMANTGKHVQTVTIVEPRLAEVAVRMAQVVAGSAALRRGESPISALLGTVTPLGSDAGSLDAGLIFAAAGVPVGFVTMPMGGSTAPITMAGSLVVAIAEALSGVCAIQAAFPGAPVFICFIPSVMDLMTGDFTGGAPEDTIMGAAVADVGAFYGLPTECGINSSGAKLPGWQSALDDTTTTLLSMACGVDMLAGVGMVAGGRIFSYEEMALAAETITQTRRIVAGIDLGALGRPRSQAPAPRPGRRSLGSRPPDAPLERARERVRAILEEHRPPPLAPSVDGELRRLVGMTESSR
jgi:trimethylamine--corrinoid protein Co-methyltransferase